MANRLSVFTKPWRTLSVPELGALVASYGFDGVEFPLRPGYQVEPQAAEQELPKLVSVLAARGVAVTSVASGLEEHIFAACAAAGVGVIRIMADVDPAAGYRESEARWQRKLSAAAPLCERYGVKVAVQQHCGGFVSGSMELLHLLEGVDCPLIGGVWDAAHSGLAGECPEFALDILWPRLLLVNFKNAYYRRVTGPEAAARFEPYFTTGRQGATDWARAASVLRGRGYDGDVCMPAEYTDEAATPQYLREDAAYLRSLLTDEGKAGKDA